jgi:hypothetical protein
MKGIKIKYIAATDYNPLRLKVSVTDCDGLISSKYFPYDYSKLPLENYDDAARMFVKKLNWNHANILTRSAVKDGYLYSFFCSDNTIDKDKTNNLQNLKNQINKLESLIKSKPCQRPLIDQELLKKYKELFDYIKI